MRSSRLGEFLQNRPGILSVPEVNYEQISVKIYFEKYSQLFEVNRLITGEIWQRLRV